MTVDTATTLDRVRAIAEEFAQDRAARQQRRELVRTEFDRLADAGFLLTGVPVEMGGLWEDTARTTRPVCELLRALAHGDSSVALVSSMHPAVLSFWLATPRAPAPYEQAWDEQRNEVFASARDGAWWGTITSEPGSGGDIADTKAITRLSPEGVHRLVGQKHFGSGSGITSYMITSAVPAGEAAPDWFYLDMRGVGWAGTDGVKLVAEWNGHGMIATQSHAYEFKEYPATRSAWQGNWREISEAQGGFIGCCFTSVIVGIVETAVEAARRQIERKRGSLRPLEQVEWARAEMEGWLVLQAYEGMLRAIEQRGVAPLEVIRAKTAIAELAESALRRICIVLGGGVYARHAPFGFWYEDVRALGFLRPPWGLAFDRLIEAATAPASE